MYKLLNVGLLNVYLNYHLFCFLRSLRLKWLSKNEYTFFVQLQQSKLNKYIIPALNQILMLHTLTPYLYSITSTICFVIMQVFFKMLIQVLPQSIVLSTQSFFLLCLNSYILFSHEAYHKTYSKYVQNDNKAY